MNKDSLSRSADIGRVVREDIQQILDEKDKTSVLKLEPTYRSVLNQPERVAISSASAIPPTEITSVTAESSFYSFVVNLPRPALNVDNLQLLSANIPQAQVSIPDDSLVFWYYRLQTQNFQWFPWQNELIYEPGDRVTFESNNYECLANTTFDNPVVGVYWKLLPKQKFESPNLFNLFCVRLLPSYYKKEMIVNATTYGYNQTFNSYEELEVELVKACDNPDLAISFLSGAFVANTLQFINPTQSYLPHVAGDISILYDSQANKFAMKGNNVLNQYTILYWNDATIYQPQTLVKYGDPEIIYINVFTEPAGRAPASYTGESWIEYTYTETTTWNTYLAAGYNDPNIIKLQGEITTLDWNKYHLFLPGDEGILYKDAPWRARKLTRGTSPPDYIFNTASRYSVGDIVWDEDLGHTYECIEDVEPGGEIWDASKKYYLDDIVTWTDDYEYQAATNYIPVGWSPFDGPLDIPTWNYEQFNPGDIVTDPSFSPSSTNWICTAQTTGLNPLDYPEYTSFDYYIVGDFVRFVPDPFNPPFNLIVYKALDENHYQSPYEYPSRWERQDTVLPPEQAPAYWQSIPTIPEEPWEQIADSRAPPNEDYWSEIYNPWESVDSIGHTSGLAFISKRFDMPYLGNTGQPYSYPQNQQNNQTLNRRLGFTWNGLNMVLPFESIERFSLGNLITLFYNRLRPIPFYWGSVVVLGLGEDYTPGDIRTYTADAFCNLVYSSVVNIYTRILGGSTTDTVRDTNLLAIVPMTCGNLGVTLFNSFIDNPLTKIDTDIYTIEVEFRTESGQPYWFSNNAVITLQLKLGYK